MNDQILCGLNVKALPTENELPAVYAYDQKSLNEEHAASV